MVVVPCGYEMEQATLCPEDQPNFQPGATFEKIPPQSPNAQS